MAREDVLANIEANKNLDFSSVGSAFFLLAGNSLIDSTAVNSFAKTNGIALQVGVKTGVYANNPIMGGNFLYNIANKMGFKPKTFSSGYFNMLANEDLAKGTKLGDFVQGYADANNLSYNTEVVRGGYGLSFRKHGFIKAMNKAEMLARKFPEGKTKEATYRINKVFAKAKHANIKNADDYKAFIGKLSKDEKAILKNFNIKDVTSKEAVEKSMGNLNEILSLEKESYKLIENGAEGYKNYFLGKFKRYNKSQMQEVFDAFIDDGGKLTKYKKGTIVTEFTDDMIEELAEQAGIKYGTQTGFQKVMGNKWVRFLTGNFNLLPKGFNLPVAITSAALGITASVGQSNAVNNFITSNLYNTSDSDYYSSERAVQSISSSYQISDLNLQSLVSAYSNINTARRYMNDLDPLGIEASEEYGSDTFTLDAE